MNVFIQREAGFTLISFKIFLSPWSPVVLSKELNSLFYLFSHSEGGMVVNQIQFLFSTGCPFSYVLIFKLLVVTQGLSQVIGILKSTHNLCKLESSSLCHLGKDISKRADKLKRIGSKVRRGKGWMRLILSGTL